MTFVTVRPGLLKDTWLSFGEVAAPLKSGKEFILIQFHTMLVIYQAHMHL